MKNLYLFLLAVSPFISVYGQNDIWFLSAEEATKNLTVDTENNPPDGSVGSWYKWEINNNASIIGTGDDPDGPGTNDNNQALITWNATFPTSYVANNTNELIKDYLIIATEYNNCDDVNGSSTTTEVKLVKLDILSIEVDSNICNEDQGNITIYGTPNASIAINLIGGELVNQTSIIIGSDGRVDIPIKPTGNSEEIGIQIAEMSFNAQNPYNNSFSLQKTSGFSFDVSNLKINVGTSPIISPIMF